ncbi:hypothetical protein KUCAC02_000314 [Chaenocephalus aceratus]|uniref:Uncharacterized protein n=1 Tax=Chaenocephalus aceratus TaxID=36190 RepID=A0ACB9W5Z4_CHAAC|nr:hypothetical protein KUCAC02_000314 [Chaenocephalus aceratus]
MSTAESTYVSTLGKGDSLHQQVLASFPLCDITEEDLTQNAQFCKLLATLAQHVDQSGLTVPLKTELEKAEQKLQSQRRYWLRSEGIHKALQEMTQDHCIRKHHATVPPDQNMNVQRMKQSLPRELEKHLKKKCLSLLSYYQPEWENESEGLKNSKLSHLSAQMDNEKKRAESLKESSRENSVLLQRQTQLYLSEQIKCIQLLQSLILDHRLRIQTDLDRKKLDYFEGKCELVLQKIKTEMVEIQLDTEKLSSDLKASQVEKHSVELKLASFEMLGKDFEALADEYCRLRQEIEVNTWALKEFTQCKDK